MRSLSAYFIALSLFVLALQPSTQAARDLSMVATDAGVLELIVIETPECSYCPLIRRDVQPLYETSASAKVVPMRFVDLNSVETDQLGLRTPLRVLPTMVLIKDGAEVDRIENYIGPELYFHAISRMISRAGG